MIVVFRRPWRELHEDIVHRDLNPENLPEPPEEPDRVPPPPPSGMRIRARWAGLRGQVEQEFRSSGAKVFREDDVVSARSERRIS